MISNYIRGNLIDNFFADRYDAIAHGCNCFCAMGNGIAREIRDRIPAAYQIDQVTTRGYRGKMGSFSQIQVNQGIVYNAYTQYTYWDKDDMLSMTSVELVFNRINADMKHHGLTKLGIPCIGAGLAHGDWDAISKIIHEVTIDIQIEVVIWDQETDPKLLKYLNHA
ncbi:hypothetical protein [Ralstonia phage RP13]|nr:hypothetical protein [Ralstonia phage RP13]